MERTYIMIKPDGKYALSDHKQSINIDDRC